MAFAAMIQAASGFGFSLILAPALQLAGESVNGIRTVNLLSFMVNLILLLPVRKSADTRRAVQLAVPAVIFTPIGVWLLLHIDHGIVGLPVGIMTIVSVLALITGMRITYLRGAIGAVLAGGVSGMMNALSGIGGPTVAIYVSNADWPRERVIPTLQIYFLVINSMAVCVLGLPVMSWSTGVFLFLMLSCGLVLGVRFRSLLSDRTFQWSILSLAAIGGAMSAIQSIVYLVRG